MSKCFALSERYRQRLRLPAFDAPISGYDSQYITEEKIILRYTRRRILPWRTNDRYS
jgi:hypothetical protein